MPAPLLHWPAGRPARGEPLAGELHVWAMSIAMPADDVAALASALAPAERERAGRFLRDRDRRCALAGRGLLRRLLGAYLSIPAREVPLGATKAGKPVLEGALGEAPLGFNLSHAGELVLAAVAPAALVGVDVEATRVIDDLDGLARSVFAGEELATLAPLAPAERHAAFFRCWTRKEAYIKAVGEGLGLPLESFAVTTDAERPPRLLRHAAPEPVDEWTFHHLDPAPGYVGAAAVRATGLELVCRAWEP